VRLNSVERLVYCKSGHVCMSLNLTPYLVADLSHRTRYPTGSFITCAFLPTVNGNLPIYNYCPQLYKLSHEGEEESGFFVYVSGVCGGVEAWDTSAGVPVRGGTPCFEHGFEGTVRLA
jgi:hypothetical protein